MTDVRPKGSSSHLNLYQHVAEELATAITNGTYRVGDRVPSVRQLARRMGVSISTVTQAYGLLVDRGVVEARPQSGYFVCPQRMPLAPEPGTSQPAIQPMPVSTSSLTLDMLSGSASDDRLHLDTAPPLPTCCQSRNSTAVSQRYCAKSPLQQPYMTSLSAALSCVCRLHASCSMPVASPALTMSS